MVRIRVVDLAPAREGAEGEPPQSIPIRFAGSRAPMAPAVLPVPDQAGSTDARRPSLTEEEAAALYADLRPLVQRLFSDYGGDPERRAEFETVIRQDFRDQVERYDPSCGRPLTAYLVSCVPQAVYVWARCRWSSDHPDELSPSPVAAATCSMSELARVLVAAMPQLPLRQRQAVVGWFYEARSIEELAERLGVRPATVRSLLRRGIKALRRLTLPTGRP